ncbi:MAG TPA: hypothetical protein VIF64_14400 [Pyrinomonadaceae bacterium]
MRTAAGVGFKVLEYPFFVGWMQSVIEGDNLLQKPHHQGLHRLSCFA